MFEIRTSFHFSGKRSSTSSASISFLRRYTGEQEYHKRTDISKSYSQTKEVYSFEDGALHRGSSGIIQIFLLLHRVLALMESPSMNTSRKYRSLSRRPAKNLPSEDHITFFRC